MDLLERLGETAKLLGRRGSGAHKGWVLEAIEEIKMLRNRGSFYEDEHGHTRPVRTTHIGQLTQDLLLDNDEEECDDEEGINLLHKLDP